MNGQRRRERGRRRSVRRWMMRPSVLAALGGGLLVAVLAGVTIGNATVEGINPVHYRAAPAPRMRPVASAAPSADGLIRRLPNHGELYVWDAGDMARTGPCDGDCAENEGIYSAQVPYFGSREELAEAERAAMREIDTAFNKTGDAPPVRVEVDPPYAIAPAVEETIAVGDQG